jgi:hypothetical protein
MASAMAFGVARADNVALSGVAIRRIVTTSDGFQFLYIDAGQVSVCDKNVWGVTYGVLMIPNSAMYAQLLSLKSQSLGMGLMIVNMTAGPYNVAWTASTSCRIDYLDQQ